MDMVSAAVIFAMGAAVGSFLNVVALRYNSGLPIARGRSVCMSCGKVLTWRELVPVLSYAWQRGRCRGCGSSVSPQYPLVELATALAFLGVWLKTLALGASPAVMLESLAQTAGWCLLIVILVYDVRHKIIPDGFMWSFIAIHAVRILGTRPPEALLEYPDLVHVALAGPLIALPLALLWLGTRGGGIGLGDAKLALGLGWMLGLSAGISAVLMGFWSGAIWSVVIMAASKFPRLSRLVPGIPRNVTRKTEIPFAPFLILGAALAYFFELSAIAL